VLPPVPPRLPRTSRPGPSPHDGDDEPDDPGVDEHVPDAHDLTDRARDPDDVAERAQQVVLGHEVVLRRALPDEQLEHVLLAGGADRGLAHRHPAVREDHRGVQQQPDEHERDPAHPPVEDGEGHEERVGGAEHGDPHETIRPGRTGRQGRELQPEPGRGQRPRAQAQPLEPAQAPAQGEPERERERDDGDEQDHVRARGSSHDPRRAVQQAVASR